MHHSILVVIQRSILRNNLSDLRQDLLRVNFPTLCRQYGLNPGLIEQTTRNLDILTAKHGPSPYFLVHYGPYPEMGFAVYEHEIDLDTWEDLLQALQAPFVKLPGRKCVNYIVEIELTKNQLHDMGLLLAYEVARWAAINGEGIVLGFDRIWYRLNKHKAFLPISRKI